MSEIHHDAIRLQLEKALASRAFLNSERMRRFLRLAVEHTLSGEKTPLKEYRIGVDVFDKGDSFDPRSDPIVRVEARRLRTKLREYYASEGIEIPERGYSPTFNVFEAPSPKPPLPEPNSVNRWRWLALVATALVAVAASWLLADRLSSRHVSSSAAPSTSIVVLPFVNMSSDPENEYF